MKWLRQLWCGLNGHNEELFRKRTDQRKLIWICSRCDKVTRSLKLKTREDREMRKLQRKAGTLAKVR